MVTLLIPSVEESTVSDSVYKLIKAFTSWRVTSNPSGEVTRSRNGTGDSLSYVKVDC